MSGSTILSNTAVAATRDTAFEPVSYQDFNGDGNADILLRHKSNGLWYLYQLNGSQVLVSRTVKDLVAGSDTRPCRTSIMGAKLEVSCRTKKDVSIASV